MELCFSLLTHQEVIDQCWSKAFNWNVQK